MLLAVLLASLAQAAPRPAQTVFDVKVLVLNFDPFVAEGSKMRMNEHCRWNAARELAEGYIKDVRDASGGRVRYQIVEWRDLDEFPVKADGFAYGREDYLRCWKERTGWHQPDLADYPAIIRSHNLVREIESGKVDEVWWFAGPYAGFYESAMAGKGAFYINGGVYGPDKVPCWRAFAIMGFNTERGVAEMLHDLSHRTESTMARVFGGWKAEKLETDWARFAANAKQSNGVAGAGNCHYPPNGERDYDYNNPRTVPSSAEDWLNYPNLTGKTLPVNRETWGGPDYHRNYMRWWFRHLPHAEGVHPRSGRRNDWWEYVFRFDAFDDRGRPLER